MVLMETFTCMKFTKCPWQFLSIHYSFIFLVASECFWEAKRYGLLYKVERIMLVLLWYETHGSEHCSYSVIKNKWSRTVTSSLAAFITEPWVCYRPTSWDALPNQAASSLYRWPSLPKYQFWKLLLFDI